jgi:hypothetical protein
MTRPSPAWNADVIVTQVAAGDAKPAPPPPPFHTPPPPPKRPPPPPPPEVPAEALAPPEPPTPACPSVPDVNPKSISPSPPAFWVPPVATLAPCHRSGCLKRRHRPHQRVRSRSRDQPISGSSTASVVAADPSGNGSPIASGIDVDEVGSGDRERCLRPATESWGFGRSQPRTARGAANVHVMLVTRAGGVTCCGAPVN